tara:strand:- start:31588 stop:31950 length:363 start_codon:yes stop_codon:yes gene_type:complete
LADNNENGKSFAVIFEVQPHCEHYAEYLDIATILKPELEKIDGFISIERFKSINKEGKILSLSFWRDEKAIREWRNLTMHREAQIKGRKSIFRDYRIRVVNVVRDYGMFEREEAPKDSDY